MVKLHKSKKAVSEVISYVLLTLLVATISVISYNFANSYLENEQITQDTKNMEIHLKKLYFKISEVQSISRASFSYDLSFDTGLLELSNGNLTYYSLSNYDSSQICIANICYDQYSGDKQKTYIVLGDNFEFTQNVTFVPGSYNFFFENMKNESKISVILK